MLMPKSVSCVSIAPHQLLTFVSDKRFLALMPGELPIRSLVVRAALLDYAHRGKCAAIEVAANCRTVLVNGAAVLTEVDAGPIRTLFKHQFTIGVPLRE